MKLSSIRENIQQALNIVSKIVSAQTSLPVLNNVLLKTENGRLKVAATNLEIGITTWVGAKIEQEGGLTVPARLITDSIQLFPNETVDFSTDNDTLFIKSKQHNATIKGISVEEFPLIPKIDSKPVVSLPALDLSTLLSDVSFAAAYDETRPEIAGVNLMISTDSITCASTDSYRLAERTIKLKKNATAKKSVILPIKTVLEVSRILQYNLEATVSLSFSENQILFAIDDTEIVSRLVEGTFPEYQAIIPTKHETQAFINRDDFIKAVKLTSFFSKRGTFDVHLSFDQKKNALVVNSTVQQTGQSVSSVVANITGKDNEIVLNYRFLLDFLSNTAGKEIVFEMQSDSSPAVMRPVEEKGYVYVIMPIKS